MARPRTNHTGKRYGRLVVTATAEARGKYIYWLCKCDCGNKKFICGFSLGKATNSCGCLEDESRRSVKHGFALPRQRRRPEYTAWAQMKGRCLNPNNAAYHRYGGRGISICDEWQHSFETFLRDMGCKPAADYSIERVNNNGNYEPGNCKWATPKEQANNRRSNVLLTNNGITKTLGEWADSIGLKQITLYMRIVRYGWGVERAINTPTT